jgi:hypothetical protein
MKRLTLLTLLCISSCFGARLVADSNRVSSPVIIDSATLSDTALINETFSNLIPQGTQAGSAYALASFGRLGVSTTAGFSLTQVLGGGSSGTSANTISRAVVYLEDYLQLQTTSPDQRLYIDLQLDGLLSANPAALNTVNNSSVADVQFNIVLNASRLNYLETPDGVTIFGTNYARVGDRVFRIWTDTASNNVNLSASLRALANCSGTIRNYADQPAAIACNAVSDFDSTLRFLGAGISDANGNAIGSPVNFVSASGFDYIAGVPAAPTGEVPEPATAALIGGSLAALAVLRRRR